MTKDAYERAAKIRRGEIDDEMPDYEELTGWIQRLPETMIPGMLTRVVHAAVVGNVFADGGLEYCVARAKANAENALSMLRQSIELGKAAEDSQGLTSEDLAFTINCTKVADVQTSTTKETE